MPGKSGASDSAFVELGKKANLKMRLAPQGSTVLSLLFHADTTQPGYKNDLAFWQKFRDANPDIDLRMETYYGSAYEEKLSIYIAAGQIPDLVHISPSSRSGRASAFIHSEKLLKDLSTLLGADFLSAFIAPALDMNLQPTKTLALLPQSLTYTTVMYTNKKLLADNGFALPRSYDDLRAMVPKLRAKGILTLLLPMADKWSAELLLFSTITGRLLGDSWVNQVLAKKAKFTDPGFVAALKFFRQLFDDGVIDSSNMKMAYGESPNTFASGKAAFLIDGDWRQNAFGPSGGPSRISPGGQANDFAFLNFPAIPWEKNPGVVSAIAGPGLGISKNCAGAKLDAAVKLVKWYYGPEFQKMEFETGAFIPIRKGITSEALQPFANMMAQYGSGNQKTCYILDGVLDPSVLNILNEGLYTLGLGTKTPEAVAAELQKAQDALPAAK